MIRARVAIALCSLLAATATVLAEPRPAAQLLYGRPPDLVDCPDEHELRNAVAGMLGYDPFELPSQRLVVATISSDATGLHVDIELRGNDGQVLGTRRLSATHHDCRELGSAMELAISVAIDPLSLSRPQAPVATPPLDSVESSTPDSPVPAVSSRPPTAAPPSNRVAFVRTPARRAPMSWRASVGALSSLGAAPSIAAGFVAQIGLRSAMVSLGLEGRADLPASTTTDTGTGGVQSSLLLASLVPCLHVRCARGCALVALGELYGAGIHVDEPLHQHTFYAATGARLGAELHLVGSFSLDLHIDLLGTLTQTRLRLADMTVWTTPAGSGSFGAGLVGYFR